MSEENEKDELLPIDFFMQFSTDKKHISLVFSSEAEFDGLTFLHVLSKFVENNADNGDKLFDQDFAFEVNLH